VARRGEGAQREHATRRGQSSRAHGAERVWLLGCSARRWCGCSAWVGGSARRGCGTRRGGGRAAQRTGGRARGGGCTAGGRARDGGCAAARLRAAGRARDGAAACARAGGRAARLRRRRIRERVRSCERRERRPGWKITTFIFVGLIGADENSGPFKVYFRRPSGDRRKYILFSSV
jgi:hypothetical protein